MRLLVALAIASLGMPFVSCTTDPDLDPQPTKPPSASSQLPHNRPVAGQGAGQFGALPNQQLRR
ncbi:hypothetical protein [Haloferula sp. A504]|uniref:hypothetical protein n=1 Tax=Haloferula sp. A504 TaxID=3373601 RepID=UPI0031C1E733|nr:hypothetical protein [Verrucomicrobiaceae bacterium E54]